MNFKEIQELVKLINKSDLSEFKMKDGEFELSIRTKLYEKVKHQASAAPAPPPLVAMPPIQPTYPAGGGATERAPAQAPTGESPAKEPPAGNGEDDESRYLAIKSPIVGTFYRSPSPEKDAYVKVGDVVQKGSVVCVVEAMKLFNEIESDIAGRIVKVLVEDAQPVEYDQKLFLIDPAG